jgi:hypothetical protein
VTELGEVIARLLGDAYRDGESRGAPVGDLYLIAYPNRVVNVTARDRGLLVEDVDAVRAALAAAGFTEVQAWEAVQGMSWLSPGVSAGVSFRVQKSC